MEMIADILLVAGALGAGFYCFVLARRLNRFNDLEQGVGGAVAVLSSQVDDLNKSLVAARAMSDGSTKSLESLTGRAETVAQRLELMMASMHDLPAEAPRRRRANEESDALAEALNAAPKSDRKSLDEPEKPSSGLMFVRHNRNQSRVA
ncbi:hypothetical protein [Parasedimentitalea psychrophila]|uniref:Uncharacterized protein n=1 Tax=Parasedimentitalea psychrophila TaxID=2997337 RepID=A0A9Y2L4I0_9RHOB|nr:hypothetical protein [Parasedimentitalea psychrophila]WIY26764.1 hypothetical protein QPJ95_07555 [Parasedimentitalea psychrophila]